MLLRTRRAGHPVAHQALRPTVYCIQPLASDHVEAITAGISITSGSSVPARRASRYTRICLLVMTIGTT